MKALDPACVFNACADDVLDAKSSFFLRVCYDARIS